MVVLLAAAAVIIASVAALAISRASGWRPAGPIVVIAFTPLLPRVHIAMGLGLDDVLPLVGVAMLVPTVDWRGRHQAATGWRRSLSAALLVGLLLLILAGAVSSVGNGTDPVDALRLLARSAGRFAFLFAIALGIALAVQARPSGTVVAARALALMGVAEAAFGLFAFLVPLPDRIGLSVTRPWSVLWGEVPGRISGTLGLSPNFTGAVLMMALVVTVGLAARPVTRAERFAWLGAALLELTALVLTFSRAPLAVALLGLIALVVLVSRPILLAPLALLVSILAVMTPIAGRFLSDVTDRLALWYSGGLMMLDNPLLGVGAGRMDETMRLAPERYMDTPVGFAVSNAHNTVLLAGAELGMLGALGAAVLNLALAASAVIVILQLGRRPGEAHVLAGAIAMLAFLAQGMVNNLFTVGVTSVVGAFTAGAFLLPTLLAAHPGTTAK